MRYDFFTKEREAAEVLPNGLKVYRGDSVGGKPQVMVFRPKATKPSDNYCFKSEEARESFVQRTSQAFDEYIARKNEYKVARSTGDPAQMNPGTVLSYSWGYDQTNVNYFQVVKRSGLTVTIRAICQELVEQTGFMSENVRPVPDAFTAPPCAVCGNMTHWFEHGNSAAGTHEYVPGKPKLYVKRIQFDNGKALLSMDHGCASIVPVTRFADGTPPLVAYSEHQSHYA